MNNDVKMICKSLDKLTTEVRRSGSVWKIKEETYDKKGRRKHGINTGEGSTDGK